MVDNLIYRTKESVNNFKEDPINNLGFLIPVAIALISLGSGIVTYIMYIFNGGYTVQINAAKKYGWFGGYSEKFTSGTTGMITSGIIGKILLLLIGIEFVVMMINYFKHNEKGKRVVMIVDLSFLVIQVILIMNIFMASIGVLVIGSIITQISKLFGEIAITPQTVAWGYAIIVMVAIITFIVLILTTKECKWMLGYTALAVVFAKILVPLIFLILQNIVSIFTGAVALLVIVAVIGIGFLIFAGGKGGDREHIGTSSDASGSSFGVENKRTKNNTNKSKEENKKMRSKKDRAYISNLNEALGIQLFKVHGTFGDYIELDNHLVNRKICSLEALEKGKFHIYDERTGREIKSIEIPWRKEK